MEFLRSNSKLLEKQNLPIKSYYTGGMCKVGQYKVGQNQSQQAKNLRTNSWERSHSSFNKFFSTKNSEKIFLKRSLYFSGVSLYTPSVQSGGGITEHLVSTPFMTQKTVFYPFLPFFIVEDLLRLALKWGWGITGQTCPDWLKMTSSCISKLNSGGLGRFWTMKIGRKWSDKPVLPGYLSKISKIYILHFFEP